MENEIKTTNEEIKTPNKKRFKILLILILFFFILGYFVSFIMVSGNSMSPTLNDGSFHTVIKHFYTIERNDVIAVYSKEAHKNLIKRVIGLPNETVEYKDNQLYINNQLVEDKYAFGKTSDFKVILKDDEYFCLGDNREHSRDSRSYGPFTMDSIFGKITRR
jgi:signal peptidase I